MRDEFVVPKTVALLMRCNKCGVSINPKPGESFVASTDGRAWHYGCAPQSRPTPAPDLREVLEEAAKIAESHAVCGCNGEQGTCLIDDTPKAIAAEIREYALSASPVSEGWGRPLPDQPAMQSGK